MNAPWLSSLSWCAVLACLGLLSAGCRHLPGGEAAAASQGASTEFTPQNYHQTTPWLPRELRRVAVLPLTTLTADALTEAGRDQLEQMLSVELTRTELFEVVRVTPDQLRRWTGRPRWGVTDALPPDLLHRIEQQLGCDGVIFAELTAYRPYPPLAMGWKLHLVAADGTQVWWTSDVLYDAGNQTVARGAVRYEREYQAHRLPASDPATILRSPGRFGQYTLAASLETLQRHEKNH